jgi:membrane protein YdbS with pleckstrin-like domain
VSEPPGVAWRRLHPITPLARGWALLAVFLGLLTQRGLPDLGVGVLLGLAAAAGALGLAYGWLSWRVTRYALTDEDLRLESGVLLRRSRRVRLARLQAVDVVRPLVARLLGLAELRLEVAGGGETEATLAYLAERDAHVLRAELLALAAGIDKESPEAPEQVLAHVPPTALVQSQLLSVPVLATLFLGAGLLTTAVVTRNFALLGPVVPVKVMTGCSARGSAPTRAAGWSTRKPCRPLVCTSSWPGRIAPAAASPATRSGSVSSGTVTSASRARRSTSTGSTSGTPGSRVAARRREACDTPEAATTR